MSESSQSRQPPTTTPRPARTLTWSVTLYRRLLLAYPARFRAAYAASMTQVFRDCCRQAQRESGLRGIGRLWLRTLADLADSALAERSTGGIPMPGLSRWTPARYCGFAAMLGGAIWIAYVLFNVGAFILPAVTGGPAYTNPNPAAAYIFSATWVLFPLGLIGVLTLAAGRVSTIAWLGFTIAFAGALMLLAGNLGTTYIWSYYAGQVEIHLTGYDPVGENIEYALYAISFLGYPVLGIGLGLAGLFLWRARALSRWNLLPLVLGVWGALQYFFTDMGAPSVLRNTGTPGLLVMVIEYALFVLAWGAGWILMGRMVWSSDDAPALAAQIQPAPAAA